MSFVLRRLISSRAPLQSVAQQTFKRAFASESNQLSLTFASPYEVLYDKKVVKQVDVPSYSGSFGILANHVPCLAVLKPGVVTVYEDDGSSQKYFVSSGTITINEDSTVQVLAEEAVPVDWIDPSASKDVLVEAQANLASASTPEAKAEAQIALEVGEALAKAHE